MDRRRLAPLTLAALTSIAGCGATQTPPPPPAPAEPTAASTISDASVTPKEPPVPSSWKYPMRATVTPSPHGAVASDCALATKAGLAMLEAGGNAVDAAVTTAFALAVAYPTAGNLGGGGFAVARLGSEDVALDFRETAPGAASRDMYGAGPAPDGGVRAAKDGGSSRFGWRATATPASVAGLWTLHKAKGTKPWKDVLAPAIAMAKDGFIVDEAFASEIDDSKERLLKDPASSALFLPGGAPPKVGSTWKNPDLARLLERIADKGPAGFYEGSTAETIAAEMKSHDGLVTLDDLRSYEAKWRTPVTFDYHGAHIVSMPPPSSGGVTLAMIAHILEPYDLDRGAWHSAAELHVVFEAMRRAFAARNARLGDPDFVQNPLESLLSPAWADAQRKTIAPDHATPSTEIASVGSPAAGGPHTTNLSVVDAAGNAVAITTTINWFFGNGITIAGTGMLLNNEMDDFASVPGQANGFGLVQGEPNAIAPKKRSLSSMSPIVVVGKDGKPELVTGAAGGPRIITSVLQILLNSVDHGFDPVAAVNAPRFHMQHLPDVVLYEKGGLEPELRDQLAAMGYSFKEAGHLADANAIGLVHGGWIAAPEPRRAGSLGLGW